MGYLRRNPQGAPSDIHRLRYETYVLPNIDFTSTICTRTEILYLTEKAVHKWAAWFITKFYKVSPSITKIKHDLSLQLLQLRRQVAFLVQGSTKHRLVRI